MKILVTTPTGRIGSRIIKELLAPEFEVRVIVRDPTRLPAEVREQVEMVRGSTDDPATLRWALEGIDSVFWCTPAELPTASDIHAHYERFALAGRAAMRAARTTHMVTISTMGSERAPWTTRLAGLRSMERILDEAGAAIRHLRCGWFMENLLEQWSSMRDHGLFSYPFRGQMAIPMVAVEDVADVALRFLVRSDWVGHEAIRVQSPQRLSFEQAARVLEAILERPLKFKQASVMDLSHSCQPSQSPARASNEFWRPSMAQWLEELALDIEEDREASGTMTLNKWAEKHLLPKAGLFGRPSNQDATAGVMAIP